ncbi:MAG: hypothetical protein ACOYNC_10825 [Bacteroidales bacterium]
MKKIELKDEESWWIELRENREQVKYTFSDKEYSNLERIYIDACSSCEYPFADSPILNAPNLKMISVSTSHPNNLPSFDGPIINAPNIKYLMLTGEGSIPYFQSLIRNCVSPPVFEAVQFLYTGVSQLPDFILMSHTIEHLTFRHESLSKIPDTIFQMTSLKHLSFEHVRNIKTIPDDLKKLVNLTQFDLWEASIDYLSPDLFLLPEINSISFACSEYKPTPEVLGALKTFKAAGCDRFVPWANFPS